MYGTRELCILYHILRSDHAQFCLFLVLLLYINNARVKKCLLKKRSNGRTGEHFVEKTIKGVVVPARGG